jgi:hypothetical protein
MLADVQKVKRPSVSPVKVALALVSLLFIFRFTSAIALIVVASLYAFFPLHRSLRAIQVSYVLFFVILLIPVDVYVPGFHGPLEGDKHSGLRFVYVVHGMPMRQNCLNKYGEFIAGGCVGGMDDTRWRLVWD